MKAKKIKLKLPKKLPKLRLPKLKMPKLKMPKLPPLQYFLEGRRKQKLIRAAKTTLIVALVLVVIWACWLVWVDRYVIYTRDGAEIDFSLSAESFGAGTLAVPPENPVSASIYFDDGSNTQDLATALTQVDGYYIDSATLSSDIDTVRATVSVLPVGSTVMLDVKNIKGNFYYTSKLEGAKTASEIDAAAMDRLIADMTARNLYVVAAVPAFCDRAYGLEHTNNGLPYIGGSGALWIDDSGCYWLNPSKGGTLAYLQSIAAELRGLGFDEVMFTDFRFPDTDQLDYSGNKTEAIQSAAQTLVEKCTTETFAVSFLASNSTVGAVEGRSRLYLDSVSAASAASIVAGYGMEDPATGAVFITESHDTRYEEYGVLRPITSFVGND